MRGRFSIFIFVVAVLLLLVGLNAASYVRVGREPELEAAPDRSTSNAGPTGTRALYDFLAESGRKVARWREEPSALLTAEGSAAPATFVVVGRVRRPFTPEDRRSLMRWVARGGRLVVIDRDASDLMPEGERWGLTFAEFASPPGSLRADDAQALTAGSPTLAPAQPTLLTRAVERVVLSRFASRVRPTGTGEPAPPGEEGEAGPVAPAAVGPQAAGEPPPPAPADDASSGDATGDDAGEQSDETDGDTTGESNDNAAAEADANARGGSNRNARGASGDNARGGSGEDAGEEFYEDESASPRPSATASATPSETPTPVPVFGIGAAPDERAATSAPVVHLSDERGALLAEYRRGQGSVVVLTDPFVVANNGIGRADNLQLALNVLTARDGLVVFDEFHQGRGATHAQLLSYFAGTPVIAIAGQAAFIVALVGWSRGRRFARPLPAARVDRRSKLEFVASMAELQQRARAFDLAIENIYSRTRRALARYGGADVSAPREEIAAAVAARSGIDRARLEALMRECEDAANGAPVAARRALSLAAQLRELERALGIRMRAREIKQAGRL